MTEGLKPDLAGAVTEADVQWLLGLKRWVRSGDGVTYREATTEEGERVGRIVALLADHKARGEALERWRPEVVAFADLMEAKLKANDHKPGWKDESDLDLFERLGEESAELLSALHRHAKRLAWGDGWVMETDTEERIGREAADVANFAMMIADVCGALSPLTQTGGAPLVPLPVSVPKGGLAATAGRGCVVCGGRGTYTTAAANITAYPVIAWSEDGRTATLRCLCGGGQALSPLTQTGDAG